MERKIGEIFEYDGEWYQCVESYSSCEGCDFKTTLKCSYAEAKCSFPVRQDHTSVIFKKLEKVGEQFLYKGKQMQSYIRATDELICNWNNNLLLLEHGDSDIIDIETKQNKENMGEKNDIRPYDELFSPGTVSNTKHLAKDDMEEKKLKLKPFDIKKAKEGKPVCTRNGRKARIVCFDSNGGRPIVALVTECDDEEEIPYKYHCDGFYNCQSIPSDNDLMMLPEKKEGWVNIYKERIYSTKEEAIEATYNSSTYIDTIKFSWEE